MNELNNSKIMSVKNWLVTFLITAIPFVGFIMLFVWAFGNDENVQRKNWAKAQLLFMVIIFALVLIFMAAFWSFFAASFAGANY